MTYDITHDELYKLKVLNIILNTLVHFLCFLFLHSQTLGLSGWQKIMGRLRQYDEAKRKLRLENSLIKVELSSLKKVLFAHPTTCDGSGQEGRCPSSSNIAAPSTGEARAAVRANLLDIIDA